MAKKTQAPALEPHEELRAEISEMRTEVANLRDHIRVLNEILDGIREDLQWVTQNGLEVREPLGFRIPSPVLKSMALDPAASDDDWGSKLDINHGLKSSRPEVRATSTMNREVAQPPKNEPPSHPALSAVAALQPSAVESSSSPAKPTPQPPKKRGNLF